MRRMRKLLIGVTLSLILAVLLFITAFYYIDKISYKVFRYELYVNENFFGFTKIDRYVTEDKIIYKSFSEFPHSLNYSQLDEKLFLKRSTMTPLKYEFQANNIKGEGQTLLLKQKKDKTDLLFVERPRYFSMKDFETGDSTMVFSPENIMLYMPIMDEYNYWKKGAQFFEVMIPLDEPVPVLRDKIEVRYKDDEYVPVMGRRVDAERFSVSSNALPEAEISVSKYTHRLLSLEIKKLGMRFILTASSGGFEERVRVFAGKIISFIDFLHLRERDRALIVKEEELIFKKGKELQVQRKEPEIDKRKEVSFKSGNLTISGNIWAPSGEGPFPAVVMIHGDGPVKEGEHYMFESYARALCNNGYIVLIFDRPGDGKSQSGSKSVNDQKSVEDIISAIEYLGGNASVDKNNVSLIGYRGGGYLALKAASKLEGQVLTIMIDVPLKPAEIGQIGDFAKARLQTALKKRELGPFDENYVILVTEEFGKHFGSVFNSDEDHFVFMGTKLPRRKYREYLSRDAYENILTHEKPLLMIFSKNDLSFQAKVVENLKKDVQKKDNVKIAIFRELDEYLGKMVEEGSYRTFALDEDVFDLIKKWLEEHRVIKKTETAEEITETIESQQPAEPAEQF